MLDVKDACSQRGQRVAHHESYDTTTRINTRSHTHQHTYLSTPLHDETTFLDVLIMDAGEQGIHAPRTPDSPHLGCHVRVITGHGFTGHDVRDTALQEALVPAPTPSPTGLSGLAKSASGDDLAGHAPPCPWFQSTSRNPGVRTGMPLQ